MEYIFIMLLAILITTIFVFVLTNSILGIHLRWKPLFMCAACSMVISLALPHIVVGAAGLSGALATLVAFAVVFAYFVTKYDTYDELSRVEPVASDILAIGVSNEQVEVQQGPDLPDFNQVVELAGFVDENDADCLPTAVLEASKDAVLMELVPVAEQSEDLAENAVWQTDTAIISIPVTVDDAAMVGEQTMKIDELDEIQALDDLMDYAFVQQEQNNFHQALAAFRKAFALYADSESAPFIVIEIGNILKNKGAYDEAIQIFSEGRNLPALQYDDMLQQEFVTTIAYLRIVKNILLAQRLGFIPYNEIPGAVFAEINAEFCEWRNLA